MPEVDISDFRASGQSANTIENGDTLKIELLPEGLIGHTDDQSTSAVDPLRTAPMGI